MTRSRDWWAAGGLAARAALALLEDLGEVGDLAGRRSFDLRGRAEVEQLHGGVYRDAALLACGLGPHLQRVLHLAQPALVIHPDVRRERLHLRLLEEPLQLLPGFGARRSALAGSAAGGQQDAGQQRDRRRAESGVTTHIPLLLVGIGSMGAIEGRHGPRSRILPLSALVRRKPLKRGIHRHFATPEPLRSTVHRWPRTGYSAGGSVAHRLRGKASEGSRDLGQGEGLGERAETVGRHRPSRMPDLHGTCAPAGVRDIARRLGPDSRTLRRWVAGHLVPEPRSGTAADGKRLRGQLVQVAPVTLWTPPAAAAGQLIPRRGVTPQLAGECPRGPDRPS